MSGNQQVKEEFDGVLLGSTATIENVPSGVVNSQKAVTTAGTAEALGSSTAILAIAIKALRANTGNIYVGDASVDSTNGHVLSHSETVTLAFDNLADLYIDSDVNGEGVSYLAVTTT